MIQGRSHSEERDSLDSHYSLQSEDCNTERHWSTGRPQVWTSSINLLNILSTQKHLQQPVDHPHSSISATISPPPDTYHSDTYFTHNLPCCVRTYIHTYVILALVIPYLTLYASQHCIQINWQSYMKKTA